MRYILAGARHVRGLLAMLGGRPTEAYEHLAATFDVDQDRYHPINRWWLVPDLADAAVASGNTMQAQELLVGLPAMARRLPTPMLLLATSYTAAVLASEAEEDDQYLEALHGEVAGWSMYRARLQLRHGKRLRRAVDRWTPGSRCVGLAPCSTSSGSDRGPTRLVPSCAGDGGDQSPTHVGDQRPALRPGSPDRDARRRRPDEPADRRAPLSVAPDGTVLPGSFGLRRSADDVTASTRSVC